MSRWWLVAEVLALVGIAVLLGRSGRDDDAFAQPPDATQPVARPATIESATAARRDAAVAASAEGTAGRAEGAAARVDLRLEIGAKGTPAAGVRVRLVPFREDGEPVVVPSDSSEARTDERGLASLEAAAGIEWVALVAASAAHGTAARRFGIGTLEPGEHRARTIPLEPGVRVEGIVVDEQGRGVGGARVRELRHGELADEALSTTSRGDGSFTLEAVTEESRLSADAPGLSTSHAYPVRGGAERRAYVRIELRAREPLVGRVLAEGLPVAGARVTAEGVDSRHERGAWLAPLPPMSALSAGDGTFRLDAAPSRARIDVRATGFVPLRLEDHEIAGELVVSLERSPALVVHVQDGAGRAVADARVRVFTDLPEDPADSRTDVAGVARVEGLVRGHPASVFVRVPGFRDVDLEEITPVFEEPLVITLEPAVRLEGIVLDANEQPVDDVQVYLHRYDGDRPESNWRKVDDELPDGRFAFDVDEEGKYAVRLMRFEPYAWFTGYHDVHTGRENRVVVDPGGSGTTLRGVVRDAVRGVPVRRFRHVLYVHDQGTVRAGVDGAFLLEDVPAGAPCWLVVEADGYAEWRLPAAPLPAEGLALDVRLWPLRDLTLAVVDSAEQPLPFAVATIHDDLHAEMRSTKPNARESAGPDGLIRLSELPARTLRLEVAAFAGAPVRTVPVDLTARLTEPLRVQLAAPALARHRLHFDVATLPAARGVGFRITHAGNELGRGSLHRSGARWAWTFASLGGSSEQAVVELDLPSVALELQAAANGHETATLPLSDAGGDLQVRLPPADAAEEHP